MNLDIRWKQRFQNFDRAVELLKEPFDLGIGNLTDLEKEGTVQRFEFALELGWKCMKDYLDRSGLDIDPVTPRNVVKEAFAARILPDGQTWIDMLDHRNLLSHTYDRAVFEEAVSLLESRYLGAIEELRDWFSERIDE